MGFAIGGLVAAGSGALAGKLTDYGIDDEFIRSLAATLQPGNSALFVLLRKVQPDKVLAELKRFKGKVIRTSLSPEQESRLRQALSDVAATAELADFAVRRAPVRRSRRTLEDLRNPLTILIVSRRSQKSARPCATASSF